MNRDFIALVETIEQRQSRPFRWRRGRECVGFSAACIAAQTGRDPLTDLPSWRTRREALAVAEAEGGLEAAIDKRFVRIPPALAQRGDIAGLPDDLFGVRLMIVEGDTLVAPGAEGLIRSPRSEMIVAWSITPQETAGE
jgi:hypothetical protein